MYGSTYRFDSVAERFGDLFRQSLKKNYGRLPTAGFVAREFNLRCAKTPTITNETARRWIRGCTLPDSSRLEVFASWLDIDYNAVFTTERDSEANSAKRSEAATVDTTESLFSSDPVIRAICRLTPQQKAALHEILKLLPVKAP
jgi:hypothetical protein